MRINTNISAMYASNALTTASNAVSSSVQKLSTGLRINSASDDAAGLGIAVNLQKEVQGSSQAMKNTQDAISMLNIADGALNEQASILQRMRELVVQAKNDTYTQTERDYMGTEFGQLTSELTRIAKVTQFNSMQLFATSADTQNAPNITGSPKTVNIMSQQLGGTNPFGATDEGAGRYFNIMTGDDVGASDVYATQNTDYSNGSADFVTLKFGQMDADALLSSDNAFVGISNWELYGIDAAFGMPGATPTNAFSLIDAGSNATDMIAGIDYTNTQSKLTSLLNMIDGNSPTAAGGANVGGSYTGHNSDLTGLARVSQMRAYIGAQTNALQHTLNNLQVSIVNQTAAESTVRDVDFSTETANFTKNQILTQSATAMLAQANTMSQSVLKLLQ